MVVNMRVQDFKKIKGVSDEVNIQSCHCCDGNPHVAYPSSFKHCGFIFGRQLTADGSTMFGRTETILLSQ